MAARRDSLSRTGMTCPACRSIVPFTPDAARISSARETTPSRCALSVGVAMTARTRRPSRHAVLIAQRRATSALAEPSYPTRIVPASRFMSQSLRSGTRAVPAGTSLAPAQAADEEEHQPRSFVRSCRSSAT